MFLNHFQILKSCIFKCVLFLHRYTLKQYNSNIFKLLIYSNIFLKSLFISFLHFKTIPSLMGLDISLPPRLRTPSMTLTIFLPSSSPPSLIFPQMLQELQHSGLWRILLPGQQQTWGIQIFLLDRGGGDKPEKGQRVGVERGGATFLLLYSSVTFTVCGGKVRFPLFLFRSSVF